jgi:hypothetical protein
MNRADWSHLESLGVEQILGNSTEYAKLNTIKRRMRFLIFYDRSLISVENLTQSSSSSITSNLDNEDGVRP